MTFEQRIPVRWTEGEDRILRNEGKSHISQALNRGSPLNSAPHGCQRLELCCHQTSRENEQRLSKEVEQDSGECQQGELEPSRRPASEAGGCQVWNEVRTSRFIVGQSLLILTLSRWASVASVMQSRHADRKSQYNRIGNHVKQVLC